MNELTREQVLTRLADKFLSWPLPDSVCSDLCATTQGAPHRTGTTLLSADEAKQMLEYLLTDVLDADAALRQRAEDAEKELELVRMTLAERDRTIARLTEENDDAYLQRNHVVAALARCFPSGVRKTNIEGWSADWHGCVYIDLPAGQISYHYHDSQAGLFHGLPAYEKPYDGHTKQQVHDRLSSANAMATIARLRELLNELCSMVEGECPSLLNEDSGGNAKLALDIEAALRSSSVPYPDWCRHKDQCAGKSSCPEDPTCAD